MAQISVPCSSLVARALSLADLVNSKFISYDDLMNSLNEAWKDVYNFLTERNDDYFMTLTTLNASSALVGQPLNPNEYLIPLPDDFFKLRFLDYNYSGSWQPMKKFSLDNRGNYGTVMSYRFQGDNLWILAGPFTTSFPMIRMGYYPPPSRLYAPNSTQFFTPNTGLPDYSLATIADPFYIPGKSNSPLPDSVSQPTLTVNAMLYCDTSNQAINFVSNNTNTNVTVVSSPSSLSYPTYSKGYLYWVQSGDIYGAQFDPTNPAAVTGTQLTTSAVVTWMGMTDTPNQLAFTTNGTLKTFTLSALTSITGATVVGAPAGATSYNTYSGLDIWLTLGGVLTVNGVSLETGVSQLYSDDEYVYYVKNFLLYRGTLDVTVPATPTMVSEFLQDDVKEIGPVSGGDWLPVIDDQLNLKLISTVPDYTITYPNNLVPEMIAYQMAMDFKRKQESKDGLALLQERYTALEGRFSEVAMRDDYKPERINNASQRGVNLPGLPGGF